MNLSQTKKTWVHFCLLTGIAVLFYELGFLALLFLTPLQIAYARLGEGFGSLASLAAALVILFIGFLRSTAVAEIGELRLVLLAIEAFTLVVFLGGLYVINTKRIRLVGTLNRVLLASAVTGLLSAFFFVWLLKSQSFTEMLKSMFGQIAGIFSQAGQESASFEITALGGVFTADGLFELLKTSMLRFFLLLYVLLLSFTIKIASLFRKRTSVALPYNILNFYVPDWMVWPLLISWGFILLDVFLKIGWFSYVFWNIGLVSLFFYGLQGMGILRFLMAKKNFPRGLQMFLNFMVFLLLIIPGINIIIIFGIPLFGVSEVWIKYRQRKGNTDNESNTHA